MSARVATSATLAPASMPIPAPVHPASLPWWVVLPAGAWLTAWHGSLQHEAIHGHPTRSARLNAALAWLPIGL